MSELKHTPGPWKVSHQSGDGLPEFEGLVGVIGTEQTSSRGVTFTLYVAQYMKPDDAKLIAVAPELLEACELMIEAMVAYEFDVDDCPTPKHRSLMEFARNTIAKAKGELE